MYSIADYGAMIADDVRMGAFVRALRQAIKPGAVVIDIGTGTGIFALLACRFGARRVYAIERWRHLRHAPLPYGVAIACGGIWTIFSQGF